LCRAGCGVGLLISESNLAVVGELASDTVLDTCSCVLPVSEGSEACVEGFLSAGMEMRIAVMVRDFDENERRIILLEEKSP